MSARLRYFSTSKRTDKVWARVFLPSPWGWHTISRAEAEGLRPVVASGQWYDIIPVTKELRPRR